ncbi:MAG: ATPase, partial [Paracoccaceae bacterium]|nr:ATPase [Paracoccaceae bacterium]
CYRAPGPVELIERQAQMWDPLLDWAAEALDASLSTASGVIHVPQAPETLARLSARVHEMDNFTLAGFHDLVSLSGSLILGFAAKMDYLSPDEIWKLSRLDEEWQIELWGSDDEAEAMAETKRLAFLHAKTFVDLSRQAE